MLLAEMLAEDLDGWPVRRLGRHRRLPAPCRIGRVGAVRRDDRRALTGADPDREPRAPVVDRRPEHPRRRCPRDPGERARDERGGGRGGSRRSADRAGVRARRARRRVAGGRRSRRHGPGRPGRRRRPAGDALRVLRRRDLPAASTRVSERGSSCSPTMPFVDHELAATLLGRRARRARRREALALGLLDERDDRLVLHALFEDFLVRRARAETQVEAAEAFPTAWAYYTAQKEPDAAFDLAHRLGVPSDIDRLLIDAMDELLNSARLPTLETWASRAVRLVGRDARRPRRPGRDRAPPRPAPDGSGARRSRRPCRRRCPDGRPVSRVPCRAGAPHISASEKTMPLLCTSGPRPRARATSSGGLRSGGS